MSEYRFPILPPGGSLVPALPLPFFTNHGHLLYMDAVKSTDNIGISMRQEVVKTNSFDVLTWTPGGGYYVNITVGTPPQYQTVLIDTGSSDLYFHASNADASQTSGPLPCKGGTFAQNDSTTYNLIEASPAFGVSFADGSSVTGSFGNDTIGLGTVAIPNVQFGVAEEINSTTGSAIGLMGLGYSLNEAMPSPYPNMPEVLVNAGVTNSRLYSIFLNSEDKVSGTILFGGIDTTKYTGDLVTLDLLPDKDTGIVDKFSTIVTGATATINDRRTTFFSSELAETWPDHSQNESFPVLLDTGSAAWTVPQDFYIKHIAPAFPFVDNKGQCSCSHRDTNDSISLELDHRATITIPAHELMIPLYDLTTRRPILHEDGSDACQFLVVGMEPSARTLHSLGDAILRSMYVVYDLDNGQISVAQAAVNATTTATDVPSNVIPVPAGPSGVAQAVQGVATVAPNPDAIAPPERGWSWKAPPTTFSTLASVIGTATGSAAVPNDAQVVSAVPVADAHPPPHTFSMPRTMNMTTRDLTVRQSRERRVVSDPQTGTTHDDLIFTGWISTVVITALTFLIYKFPTPASEAAVAEGVEAVEESSGLRALAQKLGIMGKGGKELPKEAPKKVNKPKKPAPKPAREPGQEPAQEPAREPAQEPAREPAQEPAREPAQEPAQGPAQEPAAAEASDSDLATSDSLSSRPETPPFRPGSPPFRPGSPPFRPGSPPFHPSPPFFPHSIPRFPPGISRFPHPSRFPPGVSRFPSGFQEDPPTPPVFPPAPPPGTNPLSNSWTYVTSWHAWHWQSFP